MQEDCPYEEQARSVLSLLLLIGVACVALFLAPAAADAKAGKCPGTKACWPTHVLFGVTPSGTAVHRIDFEGVVQNQFPQAADFHAETVWTVEEYETGIPAGAFDINLPVKKFPPNDALRIPLQEGQRLPATLRAELTATGSFDDYDFAGNYLGRVAFSCRFSEQFDGDEQSKIRVKDRASGGWSLSYDMLREITVYPTSPGESCTPEDVEDVVPDLFLAAGESDRPFRYQGTPFLLDLEGLFELSDGRLKKPGKAKVGFAGGLPASAADCSFISDRNVAVRSCSQSFAAQGQFAIKIEPHCGDMRFEGGGPRIGRGAPVISYNYPSPYFRGKNCRRSR